MLGTVWVLILNIICMLVLTLIIATSTLIERKFLSLMQRRVGPQFVGYKGRLQYIADALKLFTKGVLIPDEANKFWFITIPSIVVALCYSFWMNAIWGPSFGLFEIEYNLLYVALFSILFGLCILLTGFFSRNKYAMLAAVRAGIGLLNLELFLGLMILNVVVISGSFSFASLVVLQEIYWFIFLFFGLSGLIVITFLLETNRAPFDLSEAESELVAGYTVEYGGFFFGLYYLGEYLHLFFFSLVTVFLFFGGWEFPNFLWSWLFNPYYFDFKENYDFILDLFINEFIFSVYVSYLLANYMVEDLILIFWLIFFYLDLPYSISCYFISIYISWLPWYYFLISPLFIVVKWVVNFNWNYVTFVQIYMFCDNLFWRNIHWVLDILSSSCIYHVLLSFNFGYFDLYNFFHYVFVEFLFYFFFISIIFIKLFWFFYFLLKSVFIFLNN